MVSAMSESLPVIAALPTTWLEQAEAELAATVWPRFEAVCHATTQRVVEAMIAHRLGEEHFYSVTGYGHNDLGREVLDAIFAAAFQAEAALVRPQMVSGTHAISLGLKGALRAGDTVLCVTGPPYDTLEEVLGKRGDASQSLRALGVRYAEINLIDVAEPLAIRLDWSAAEVAQMRAARMLYIQRSKGYGLRPSLTPEAMKALVTALRATHPDAVIMVDNCYGEFIGLEEPTAYGADLLAGSLIKNPGGGLAPTGGYVAGRTDLVQASAEVLTCPGVGADGGYTFQLTRTLLQGLYVAPLVVKEALKGMSLAAWLFERLGYAVAPRWDAPRADIIQTLFLGSPERLQQVCRLVQAHSPVNSHLTPVASHAPGYASQLMMAGGTFMDGSSVEWSADAPLREPYALFMQGGISYSHTRWGLAQMAGVLASGG